MKQTKCLVSMLILLLSAGCGYKAPLYLPDTAEQNQERIENDSDEKVEKEQ